jgi:sugar phosphate isomerase/epimerase
MNSAPNGQTAGTASILVREREIMEISSHNRRQFLAGLAAVGTAVAAPKAGSGPKIKVGACAWNIHGYNPGSKPEEAIDIIGGLGFDGIELIVLAPEDLQNYWTGATLDRLREQLERRKLQLTEFVLFQRAVPDLASPDADARARTLDTFEAGCKVAQKLGAQMVNVSSPQTPEMIGDKLVNYYDVETPKPGEKYHINLTPGFDWDVTWERFIHTTKACLARAKAHGLQMVIEPHTNTVIHDATAFLRLWDAIRDNALGINLDVGFVARQREYPPLAIYQVHKHLKNLHMRDIDGLMRKWVKSGEGVMDFKAIAETLKAVGFQGCASCELDKKPDVKDTCARYLQLMRQYLA